MPSRMQKAIGIYAFLLCASQITLAAQSPNSFAQSPDSLPEMIRQIKPAVVSIQTFDAKGQRLGLGTGFFIEPTVIVTNEHVIARASAANVKTAEGKVYSVTGLVAVDERRDLALLSIDVSSRDPLGIVAFLGKGIVKISNRLPTEGERVFVVGNPRGLEWSVSDGIVASIRENEDSGKLIQITAPISPGSSGSPVIDSKGRVIGVATLTLSNGQNLNFAIPSYQLSALRRGELKALATYNDEMKKVRRERSEQMRLRGAQIEQKAIGIEGSKAALPYMERAVEIDPDYENAWLYLAGTLEVLARHSEALDAYKRAVQIAEEAYRSSKSVDDLSDLFMGHLGLAEIYLKTENPLGATDEHKILRTLLDLLPSAIASLKRSNKKVQYDLLLYFANGLKADIEKYYKSR